MLRQRMAFKGRENQRNLQSVYYRRKGNFSKLTQITLFC
jgi:hypothetical protein